MTREKVHETDMRIWDHVGNWTLSGAASPCSTIIEKADFDHISQTYQMMVTEFCKCFVLLCASYY